MTKDEKKTNDDTLKSTHLFLMAIAAGLVLTGLALLSAWLDWRWEDLPFHSAVESVGALAAIVMGLMLLQKRGEEGSNRFLWLATGFLGMGLLDGFHAVGMPGQGFVFLHSVAGLVGAFWFALVWFPGSGRHASGKIWVPCVVVAGSLLCGIWALLLPGTLPAMAHNGQFTGNAVAINLLAGVLFMAAAVRLGIDFHRSGKLELYLFACMALLFGLAGLTFPFSSMWDGGWWFWHMLRLAAYLLVLGFMVREYQRSRQELRRHADQLENLVAERTEAVERAEHLTLVLQAIRNVNQLIVREKDRDKLLQGACDNLVETRGYHNAWIALLDDSGSLLAASAAGLGPGEDFQPMIERLERDGASRCGRMALEQSEMVIIEDPSSTCTDCPLAGNYTGRSAITVRLEHAGKVYGLLSASVAREISGDTQEHDLFHEVAGDIAFALYSLELERQRNADREQLIERTYSLGERVKELGCLYEVARITAQEDMPPDAVLQAIVDLIPPSWQYPDSTCARIVLEGRQAATANFKESAWEQTSDIIVAGKKAGVVEVYLLQEMLTSEEVPFLEEERELLDGIAQLVRLYTKRKRAEKARNLARSDLEQVFENTAAGMCVIDTDYNMERVNPRFLSMFEMKEQEVVGRKCHELWQGPHCHTPGCPMRQIVAGSDACDYEIDKELGGDKKISYIVAAAPFKDPSGKIVGIVESFVDITRRKAAEEEKALLEDQYLQSQKMEAVGRLAGGVAHDFNNMLGIITGYTELALTKVGEFDPLRKNLTEILKAAGRSSDLTRQLLAFSRRQTVEPRVLNLNDVTDKSRSLLGRLIGEDIELKLVPADDLWNVKIDPSQVDQIMVNLMVNARDAIGGVGSIIIETANMVFDEVYCQQHVEFLPGEYVQLCVTDSGTGMDKETIEHIFEPFFTTKGEHSGTGLGLSTVFGIVKQNIGFVNVYSEPGHGTTFKIYLPRAREEVPEISDAPPEATRLTGTETVLLVEDESDLLELYREILENAGYKVIASTHPGDAVFLVGKHDGQIHLLVTDVIMPTMNGKELKEQVEKFMPGIKVLYMSGYTANVVSHRGVLTEGIDFIHKPFSGELLTRKVREALDGQG